MTFTEIALTGGLTLFRVIDTAQDRDAFERRNILGDSLENLLLPTPAPVTIEGASDTASTATG